MKADEMGREADMTTEATVSSGESLQALQNPRTEILFGGATAFLFFIIFTLWMALTPLDAAAVGTGRLSVSGQRVPIQAREGGVIEMVGVKEGDRVTAGQLLFRIAAPELQAQVFALNDEWIRLVALRARLRTELSGASSIAFPGEFKGLGDEDRLLADQALELQRQELAARRNSLANQNELYAEKGKQSQAMGGGLGAQVASLELQISLIDEQLAAMRPLVDRGFVSKTRVRELERTRAALVGQREQFAALAAQSRSSNRESVIEGRGGNLAFRERLGADLQEVEMQIGKVLPRLAAGREQLSKNEVRAPVSGSVVELAQLNVGGVVASGQTLMELVPENRAMVIEVRFSPDSADDLRLGQKVEVRFPGIHDRFIEPIVGVLSHVSADSLIDERSGNSYYSAEVKIDQNDIDKILQKNPEKIQFRVGMPVQISVRVRERTALQYLIDPIYNFSREGMMEN